MTFKLRSGNKPTFKNMGSSPVKQTTDYAANLTGGEAIKSRTAASKEERLKDEIAYKKLREAELRKTLEEAPWSETRKKENISMVDEDDNPITDKSNVISATGEGGYDYTQDRDANINKYKSKEQIKQDHKNRKLESKLSDGKYTKDEKYADKQSKRFDKYQRARGTGKMGLRFNWKNMLLGDSIAAGFSVDKQENIIADKMTKAAEKRRDKAFKKEQKDKRKDRKKYYKPYQEYKKNIGTDQEAISFEEYVAEEKRKNK